MSGQPSTSDPVAVAAPAVVVAVEHAARKRKHSRLVETALVLAILAVVAPYALPDLLHLRMTANENAAVGSLQAIATAESAYMKRHGNYADLATLVAEGLVDPEIGSGLRNGYRFGQVDAGSVFAYCFCAVPTDTAADSREYCVTQYGVVFETDLDTSAMTAKGLLWTPGQDGVPEEFVTYPESDERNIWVPVGQ
jgi:type II secretory pathway pseudopilin PulG